jgi:archaellum biogenesis protein FlaJ (TadC family)
MTKINIDLTEIEIFRILDAIGTYKKNYSVSVAVSKTIKNLEKKLKKALEESR